MSESHSYQTIFKKITYVVSCTSMVSAYANNGLLEFAERTLRNADKECITVEFNDVSLYKNVQLGEALNLFYAMCKPGANIASFTSLLLFNMYCLAFGCYLTINIALFFLTFTASLDYALLVSLDLNLSLKV